MKKVYHLIACALVVGMVGCATTGQQKVRHHYTINEVEQYRPTVSGVPLVLNDKVLAWVDYFTGTAHDRFQRYLNRAGKYYPMMRDVLASHRMPEDLIFLAMIESGFTPTIRSHASAVGCWQFIRATGQRYGLKVDAWVDERRDATKSTHAAAKYLGDLYKEFGDWYLAFAGYNAGEGKVRRAIAEHGTRDFWKLAATRSAFRPETRDYVPKFIAAAIIARAPNRFGFDPITFQPPPKVDTVEVDSQADFDVIAKSAGVDRSVVEELNLELHNGVTPPGRYTINLPEGKGESFKVAFAQIPKNERFYIVQHRVHRGDTFNKIAKRYGVSVKELMAANNIRAKKAKLRAGEMLTIPRGAGAVSISDRTAMASRSSGKSSATYTVRRGDTLGGVARKQGVSLSDLRNWNRLSGNAIKVGQRLKVSAPAEAVVASASSDETTSSSTTSRRESSPSTASTYRVKKGDSWWSISQAVGISVDDLKSMNASMAASDYLKAGKVLTLVKENDIPPASQLTKSATASTAVPVETSPGPALATESAQTYVVKPGDTLSTIASRLGMSVATLCEANGINRKSPIKVGQTLMIARPVARSSASSAPVAISEKLAMNNTSLSTPSTYVVKDGDTLWSIARHHGVRTTDIQEWNNLSNASIRPGDKLSIRVP